MRRQSRPEIGTVMWSVHEHFYYISERTGPIMEYVVLSAEVTGFFEGGFVEICLSGKDGNGFPTPYFYPLKGIGKCIFYTAAEAAELAKEETEKYERVWGWMGAPDIPLRRTWEKYLRGAE